MEIKNEYIGITVEQFCSWDFICEYYKDEFGVEIERFGSLLYSEIDKHNLVIFLHDYLNTDDWKRISMPRYPDIILLNRMGCNIHTGIVVGDNKMLHLQLGGSVIEPYNTERWTNEKRGSVFGFYRYVKERIPCEKEI